MKRLFCFLVGFGLTVIGLVFMISYLNLLTIGYSFLDYVKFISRRGECLITIIGIIVMYVSTLFKGGQNELYI